MMDNFHHRFFRLDYLFPVQRSEPVDEIYGKAKQQNGIGLMQ
jgi:hypothetical protein